MVVQYFFSFLFSSLLSRDTSMHMTRIQSAQDAQRAREEAEGKSSEGRHAGTEDRGAAEDEDEEGGEEDDDEEGDPLRASTALLALGGTSADEEE